MGQATKKVIKPTIRLRLGEDDELINGLYHLAEQPGMTVNQVLKDALKLLINAGQPSAPGAIDVDLTQIRQVVEAGVESAMARFGRQIMTTGVDADGQDEEDDWLDNLGASLELDGG